MCTNASPTTYNEPVTTIAPLSSTLLSASVTACATGTETATGTSSPKSRPAAAATSAAGIAAASSGLGGYDPGDEALQGTEQIVDVPLTPRPGNEHPVVAEGIRC